MKHFSSIFWLILISTTLLYADTLEWEYSLPDFDTLWNWLEPDKTEEVFVSFLDQAEQSGDTSYLAQLLTQIARAQGLQMKFDQAHQTLDRVENMLTEDLTVAEVRYLLERGRVYNSSGYPDSAKPLFLDAYQISTDNHLDHYALDAAHMMAIAELPENQMVWNLIALNIAEISTDEQVKSWRGSLYNNIGWTYFDLGQYDSALILFDKGLKWREEVGDEEGARIAKWCVGRVYREIGEIDQALQIQHELEQEIRDNDLPPDGYVFEELGECFLVLEQLDQAQKYFSLAYDILSEDPWVQENEPERLERLLNLKEMK